MMDHPAHVNYKRNYHSKDFEEINSYFFSKKMFFEQQNVKLKIPLYTELSKSNELFCFSPTERTTRNVFVENKIKNHKIFRTVQNQKQNKKLTKLGTECTV